VNQQLFRPSADVPEGEPLLHLSGVDNLALAIGWRNFAATHGVASGPEWRIEVAKRRPSPKTRPAALLTELRSWRRSGL
jgi:hypothetical protein